MRKSKLFLPVVLIAVVGAAAILWWQSSATKHTRHELRILAYVGYDEPEFLAPLEAALDSRIVVETYVGGEEMYSKFTQAPPGTYDVVVLDAEYGERLFAEGQLISLDRNLWYYDDLFSKFADGSPGRVGDHVYAVAARWGAIGLVYNTDQIEARRVQTYDVLYADDIKGHVGIYDWYLPNMGILSLSLGNPEPYNIDRSELNALEDHLLQLRGQVTSIQPSPGQVLQDLRSGKTWLAPGIGEWAAASLATEGLPIDWSIPAPGGVMWVEAFSISSTSSRPDLAKRFVKEVMSPRILALLATRKAYYSQLSRMDAYAFVEPKRALQFLNAQDLDQLSTTADILHFRHLPGPRTTEQDWLAVWTRFKAAQ